MESKDPVTFFFCGVKPDLSGIAFLYFFWKCIIFTIMKNTLFIILLALLFVACGNDSSTSANNSNDDVSSKSSSSQRSVSSSSDKVADVIGNSMTDSRDGQKYKTVKIGSQVWMAQNLNYEMTDSYCYGNNARSCTKYGRLYTWAAAMDSAGIWSTTGKGCGYGKICSPTYPVRGVCPSGWHLPTQAEWNTLFTVVGGSSVAGEKLKSTSGWYNNGNGTDGFGFSALPAGYRRYYGFSGGNNCAGFWSASEHDSNDAYYIYLSIDNVGAYLELSLKDNAFSVRCLKD